MIIKNIFKHSAFLFFFSLLIVGCAKDPAEPEEETSTTPAAGTKKFTWTLSGGTLATAEDFYFVPSFSNIYASKTNGSNVDITLEDLTKGTHTIAPSNGITLVYTSSTSTLNANSGSVVITENTGTSITGSFTCTLTGGGATSSIRGDFNNVPKK